YSLFSVSARHCQGYGIKTSLRNSKGRLPGWFRGQVHGWCRKGNGCSISCAGSVGGISPCKVGGGWRQVSQRTMEGAGAGTVCGSGMRRPVGGEVAVAGAIHQATHRNRGISRVCAYHAASHSACTAYMGYGS